MLGHEDSVSTSETGEQKAEDVMKSDSCKNRKDTASEPIDIEWHVCLGEASVQILKKLQGFLSKVAHALESFAYKIIFAGMFNNITKWRSQKVQDICPAHAKEVATYAGFRLGDWCICGPGSENTLKCNEERPICRRLNVKNSLSG